MICKDRYNRVIHELKHFVKDKRREKYYIAKLDPDKKSMVSRESLLDSINVVTSNCEKSKRYLNQLYE
jgi:hypothetical protein